MTEETSKRLSRRDALKLIGAATGAAVLANLPSKWVKPELVSGVLPAHAQTSGGCPAGSSSLLVYIVGPGVSIQSTGSFAQSGNFASGFTAFADCQTGCIGFWVTTSANANVQVRFTVNGVVVFDQTYNNNTIHSVMVDGATGAYGLDGNFPQNCFD